ncbi:hypothetical protein KIPB_002419, partial [Kipferlia bialata]
YICTFYVDADLELDSTGNDVQLKYLSRDGNDVQLKYLSRDGFVVLYGWDRLAQKDRDDAIILNFNGDYQDPTNWTWGDMAVGDHDIPSPLDVAVDGGAMCQVPPLESEDSATQYFFGGYMESEGASNCMSKSETVSVTVDEQTVTASDYDIILHNQLSPPESSLLASAVVGDKMYIFGGSRVESASLASVIWSLDLSSDVSGTGDEGEETSSDNWEVVETSSYLIPDPRERLNMHAWGGNLLVMLGSDTTTDTYLNDVWVFWLDTQTWEQVYPTDDDSTGDEYPPTSGACTVLQDNYVYVYGGQRVSSMSDEMWRFDLLTHTWTQLEHVALERPTDSSTGLPFTDEEYEDYQADNTPPALMACHVDNVGGRMFLYGGELSSNGQNYDWYEVSVKGWGEAENGAGGQDADRDEGAVPTLGTDQVAYRRYQYPDNDYTGVHSSVDNAAFVVQRVVDESEDPSVDDSVWSVWTLGGRLWTSAFAYRYITTLGVADHSVDTQINTEVVTDYDMLPATSGTAYQYHGSTMYIYGGVLQALERIIDDSGSSDLYKATLTPVHKSYEGTILYDSCSPGTYYSSEYESCTACPMGTYKSLDESSCVTCPDGYYSETLAARNLLVCTPCPEGQRAYFDTPGDLSSIDHSKCMDCDEDEYCPIGSITAGTKPTLESDTEVQPDARSLMTGQVETWTRVCYVLAGFLCVLLAVMLLITYPIRHKINVARWDRFTLDHPIADNAPPINRQTKIGGYFTLIYYLFALAMGTSLVLAFWMDNVQETKSTIPNFLVSTLSLGDASTTEILFNATINVEFSFFGSESDCVSDRDDVDQFGTCSDTMTSTVDGLYAVADEDGITPDACYAHQCAWIRTDLTGTDYIAAGYSCHVQYTMSDCVFETDSETDPYVYTFFSGTAAHSQGITADISFGSSVPDETTDITTDQLPSTVSLELVPSVETVFKGMAPSVVTIGATPSLYQDATGGGQLTTGYHIELDSKETGDVAGPAKFPYVNGVGTELVFMVRDSTLVTTLSKKTTIGSFVGVALGSVMGLSGTFSLIMGYIEDFFQQRKTKLKATLEKKTRKMRPVKKVSNPLAVTPAQRVPEETV